MSLPPDDTTPSSSTSSFFLPPDPALTPSTLSPDLDSLPSSTDSSSDTSTITHDDDDDDDDDDEGSYTSSQARRRRRRRRREHDEMQHSDAERQWRESLQQLELLLTMVVVPYLGKYFGRKAAYWGWAKYMEWMYPVRVVFSDKAAFRAAGIVGAASAL